VLAPQLEITPNSYVLVACICKDDHRKALQSSSKPTPLNNPYWTFLCQRISLGKMINDKNDKVANGDQCYYTSIFQRVKSAKKGQWNDNKPMINVSNSLLMR
jgi:hypothetical protein